MGFDAPILHKQLKSMKEIITLLLCGILFLIGFCRIYDSSLSDLNDYQKVLLADKLKKPVNEVLYFPTESDSLIISHDTLWALTPKGKKQLVWMPKSSRSSR